MKTRNWNLWVYPKSQPPVGRETEPLISEQWDDSTRKALLKGADVLLLPWKSIQKGRDVIQYFRPAFWNTSWIQMNPPHTLGLWIDCKHAIFRDFPTAEHSDYQWWELVQEQPVVNLDSFPADFTPIVQPIDTWFYHRRLGLLMEMRVGNGRLVICSSDLLSDWKNRPVAEQLFHSIVQYMRGTEFDPTHAVEVTAIDALFEPTPLLPFDPMTDTRPDELIPEIEEDS